MQLTIEQLKRMMLAESTSRHCAFYKASDGRWYMELADEEYAGRSEANTYGPFSSMDKAVDYLDGFSNPGGWDEDDSGKRPPPTKSPNGSPIQRPSSRSFGGLGGTFTTHPLLRGSPFKRPLKRDYDDDDGPAVLMSDSQLRNEIQGIIHDHGDEYGWDEKPSVASILDQLYDKNKHTGYSVDSVVARRIATEMLGGGKKPAPAPKPVPSTIKKPRAAGKKNTYKIYNGTGTGKAVTGSSPIHTRIKGKVYAPSAVSRFKPGQQASVELGPDGKLRVKDPEGDHTQTWQAREEMTRVINDIIELL